MAAGSLAIGIFQTNFSTFSKQRIYRDIITRTGVPLFINAFMVSQGENPHKTRLYMLWGYIRCMVQSPHLVESNEMRVYMAENIDWDAPDRNVFP